MKFRISSIENGYLLSAQKLPVESFSGNEAEISKKNKRDIWLDRC